MPSPSNLEREKKNICVFCRKDCSFLAHLDGLCISCGDLLFTNMKKHPEVVAKGIVGIVANIRDIERLEAQLKRV